MLYWEQRLGNWAAMVFAEQDVVLEEISPFNNRLLIETLLSSPRNLRAYPDYPLYWQLISEMWPEVLGLPFNPQPLKKRIMLKIRPFIPEKIKALRRTLSGRPGSGSDMIK